MNEDEKRILDDCDLEIKTIKTWIGIIEKYLEQFDINRKVRFSNLLNGSQDKGNLKSLVNLRNDIAHGRTINSSINAVESYFESGKIILEILEEVINDSSDTPE